MEHNPYAPDFDDLPDRLAVFPLSSAFLLPNGQLPLNIFEPRYLQMVEDAMAADRMIGMIQPLQEQRDTDVPALQKTGCAGKIIEFSETRDGRYLITLAGVYRFDIALEHRTNRLYRLITPDWSEYKHDIVTALDLCLDRAKLKTLLKNYFQDHEMRCDWGALDNASDGKLITCLSMICPFEPLEKQALLEAESCIDRANLFMNMLEIAVQSGKMLDQNRLQCN